MQTQKKHETRMQKRFYAHSIRNDKDMYEKLQYMYHNPVKHQYIDDPKKWQYSSFTKTD